MVKMRMKYTLIASLLSLALLAGCGSGKKPWHGDNISGIMPDLQFSMTRANDGVPVTADAYHGKVVLLYFGYTNCPDVCPITLANLADMLSKLGNDAKKVGVLFVTVDPNRDTLKVLRSYVKAFAPQVDGLRGTPNQITRLTRAYRVAYSVTPASPGHPYTVTHSSAVFIFDRKGHARLVYTDTTNTAAMADDVERLLH
jgi:protein SCO1/2